MKIDSVVYTFVEKEKQPNAKRGNHFNLDVARLLEQIADLNVRLEQEYQWLESATNVLKPAKELLLRTTLATLFDGE